jgi:hypothetical protein
MNKKLLHPVKEHALVNLFNVEVSQKNFEEKPDYITASGMTYVKVKTFITTNQNKSGTCFPFQKCNRFHFSKQVHYCIRNTRNIDTRHLESITKSSGRKMERYGTSSVIK